MLLYFLAPVVAFLVVGFIWGVLHLRNSQKVAYEAIRKVSLDQIDGLRRECEAVFRQRFGETLALEELESSARILSSRLDNEETLKKAFAKPDFYWYFVLPIGAYLGELLRVHAKGSWKTSNEGGLEMDVPVGEGFATTFPFDKVMKQVTVGDKGDVYAYLMTALHLEKAAAGLPASGT